MITRRRIMRATVAMCHRHLMRRQPRLFGVSSLLSSSSFGLRWFSPSHEKDRPGMHQTQVVDDLWAFRQKVLDEEARNRDRVTSVPGGVASSDDVESYPDRPYTVNQRTPAETEVRYTYNFSTDDRLVDAYANPSMCIRMGKILEDLDALAGTIAFRFCHNSEDMDLPPLMIVTASADRVTVKHRANLKDNMVLTGKVAWAGRSSMEIVMSVRSDWSDTPWISSRFTFVARDIRTGKAAPVNKLLPTTDEEKALFAIGEARDKKRKAERAKAKQSFGSVKAGILSWNSEADIVLARTLLSRGATLEMLPHLADRSGCLMSSTKLTNAFLCQRQQRNIHGRVFGGFLMRRASELAYANCYQFSGVQPRFRSIGDVAFLQPVDVGDMLKFESWVLFTQRLEEHDGADSKCFAICLEVFAYKVNPGDVTSVISNKFNFLFHCYVSKDKADIKEVFPGSAEDAHMIVSGIREQENSSDI